MFCKLQKIKLLKLPAVNKNMLMHSIPRGSLAICFNFPVFVCTLHLTIGPISMIHWVSPLLLLPCALCAIVVCVAPVAAK